MKLVHTVLAMAAVAAISAASAAEPATPHPQPALRVAHAENGVLFDVDRLGETLIAVGGHGNILRSTDGKQWTQLNSPVDTALTRLSFADAQHGWAVGHDAVILHTADAGASWQLQNFEPALNSPLFSVVAVDAQTAVAVGAFGLLKRTADAGASWQDINTDQMNAMKAHLFAVVRLHDGSLLTVGEMGLMASSTDAGQSWTPLPPVYDGSLFGALPHGEHGAVVYGLLGHIFVTDDVRAGPWTQLSTDSAASLFGGAITGSGELLVVGANSTIVAIAADGHSAKALTSASDQNYATLTSAIPFGTKLVLVGEDGVRVRDQQ